MVIAVLAALKAGTAYVPIDPEYPDDRIYRTLETSGASCLITHQQVADRLSLSEGSLQNLQVVVVEKLDLALLPESKPAVRIHPDGLAYIIFTSGSTGTPKGVSITHRSAANTVLDINARFGVSEKDCVLALSSLSFDLSVYDIFGLLAAGGTVVIPPSLSAREPDLWAKMLHQHKVTIWNTVPALMQMYVDYVEDLSENRTEHLRLIMMSGDWIPLNLPDRIRNIAPETEIISLGGATEASIWSIWYPVTSVEPTWSSIPYGKPLYNQSFYVLDNSLSPCPVMVPGHLYIGGIGLAQGYWRDEQKTQAAFITHPQTGERLYRTGDLGRYLNDGNIEFLGRDDFQVKIRGFRIELGDIEAAVCRHPQVKEATIIAHEEGGDKRLIAYFVPRAEGAEVDSVVSDCQRSVLSEQELNWIEQQVNQGALADKVVLHVQHNRANNFEDIQDGSIDIVVMNDVQDFSSIDSFVNMLEKAMATVAHGGSIFISDVRNLKLLEAFHAAAQFRCAEDALPLAVLKQRIQQAVCQEENLFVDPEFFEAIQQDYPRIQEVQVLLKAGEMQNDVNRFCYDVVLQLDEGDSQPISDWMDWRDRKLSLSQVNEILDENQLNFLTIKNIPMSRLSHEKYLLGCLEQVEWTVGDVGVSLQQAEQGVNPDQFLHMAEGTNYTATISYDGAYQYAVVFQRIEEGLT
jgi:amino acid adenylation domain-containing protein